MTLQRSPIMHKVFLLGNGSKLTLIATFESRYIKSKKAYHHADATEDHGFVFKVKKPKTAIKNLKIEKAVPVRAEHDNATPMETIERVRN